MLNSLNRSAVIITPKQSFLDMVAHISGEKPEKEASPLTEDESTIYLVEKADLDELTMEERLSDCYKDIFFEELEDWFADTSRWPEDVTWKEFEFWFNISFQSVVLDTVDVDIDYD